MSSPGQVSTKDVTYEQVEPKIHRNRFLSDAAYDVVCDLEKRGVKVSELYTFTRFLENYWAR